MKSTYPTERFQYALVMIQPTSGTWRWFWPLQSSMGNKDCLVWTTKECTQPYQSYQIYQEFVKSTRLHHPQNLRWSLEILRNNQNNNGKQKEKTHCDLHQWTLESQQKFVKGSSAPWLYNEYNQDQLKISRAFSGNYNTIKTNVGAQGPCKAQEMLRRNRALSRPQETHRTT